MRFLFRVAAPIAAIVLLTACSARADIGAPATPPPAQPQVIVVSPPAAPQPEPQGVDDGTVVLLILIMLAGFTVAGVTGFLIAKVHSMGQGQSASSAPAPYSQASGFYSVTIELTREEAAVIAEWRERRRYLAREDALRYLSGSNEVRR